MNPEMVELIERRVALDRIAKSVIGCAHKVAANLGHGFVEKVYENALCTELELQRVHYTRQQAFKVWYEGRLVGDFVADLFVEDQLLVELKAVGHLADSHRMQCLDYLKAARMPLCLLINFGNARIEVKRIVNHF